jgi:hypothetical protein
MVARNVAGPLPRRRVKNLREKEPFDCRFHCPSRVFTAERGLVRLQTGLAAVGEVVPEVSQNRDAPNRRVLHEYLAACQPARLLQCWHRLGIVQHCEVRDPSALKIKAQVASRSPA